MLEYSKHDEIDEPDEVALLNLLAACTLQDIEDLQGSNKGKSRQGSAPTDEQIALEIFAEEANALLISARDLEIALALEQAMRMDSAMIEEFSIAEERASRDREMALALSQGRVPPPRPPTPLSPGVCKTAADSLEAFLAKHSQS